MLISWLGAFVVTQLVECPIYRIALQQINGHKVWLYAFSISLFTHPIVFFVFPFIDFASYWDMLAAAEAFAVLVEAMILRHWGCPRPITVSVVANVSSAGIGLGLRAITGFP